MDRRLRHQLPPTRSDVPYTPPHYKGVQLVMDRVIKSYVLRSVRPTGGVKSPPCGILRGVSNRILLDFVAHSTLYGPPLYVTALLQMDIYLGTRYITYMVGMCDF